MHSQKLEAEIIQIIPWEKKDKFFPKDRTKYGDEPVDLIVLGRKVDKKESWLRRLLRDVNYDDMLLDEGLPITVERPHDLKEGNIVELELSLKKVR